MSKALDPQEIPTKFAQAWNSKDARALAQLFARDADFVNVVGLWWHSRAQIERAHDYGLTTFFKDSTLSIGRTKVRLLGDDAATVHARMKLTGQLNRQGKILDGRSTVMVFVLQRGDSGWIVVAAHNTDVVPGKETLAAVDGDLKAVDYRH
jgi:uncharacterized protein (TIGR02246 family)